LILDLRWCPGGLLNESVEAARLFLEEGVIVKIKTRTEEPQVYRAGEGTRYIGFPMVVLLNGETSGGAELIAAALQDHDRAWVAGQRSRGKANIQKIMGLPLAGAGLRLTIGTFQRPCGQNLHRFPDSTTADDWGVCPEPELELRLSPDLTRQLRQWWQEQTDRPGQATRVLPLDDLTADPQRHAALQALRRKIRNPKSEIRNPKSEIRNPKSP
jgi:carboxyl-terminal processing protease